MKLPLLLFGLFFGLRALADEPPAPPANVTVVGGLLTWTQVTSQTNLTFTVQVSNFEATRWRDVPACVRTTSTWCNVTAAAAEDSEGCAWLRVRAERGGLRSMPVQACSHNGNSCSPSVALSTQPGALTVHLSRNNQLVAENADHAGFRVYYGLEGGPLRDNYRDTLSSLTLPGLESGRRYCVQVGFTLYTKAYGPPSCTRCLLVPHAASSPSNVVLTVVLVVVPLAALLVIAIYVLLFRYSLIKRCLSLNRYHIPVPTDLTFTHVPVGHCPVATSHQSAEQSEEHFDIISSITPTT